jgi:hypothetical protein
VNGRAVQKVAVLASASIVLSVVALAADTWPALAGALAAAVAAAVAGLRPDGEPPCRCAPRTPWCGGRAPDRWRAYLHAVRTPDEVREAHGDLAEVSDERTEER